MATAVRPFGPAFAGPAELRAAAKQVGHDVYWAGEGQTGQVELTLTGDGRVFVRYLTGGAAPGEKKADFLTVATYDIKNADTALANVAKRPGRKTFDVPGGGLGVANDADPQRVYFTPAGTDLQIEVFDPKPGRAMALVEAGQIVGIS